MVASVSDDLKQVSTQQLLTLMDQCEVDGMRHRVPDEIVALLDAEGTHVMQAHPIHQEPDYEFIRARAMFKLLNQDDGSEIYFVDVREERWNALPNCYLD